MSLFLVLRIVLLFVLIFAPTNREIVQKLKSPLKSLNFRADQVCAKFITNKEIFIYLLLVQLAKRGMNVVLISRSEDKLNAVAEEFGKILLRLVKISHVCWSSLS